MRTLNQVQQKGRLCKTVWWKIACGLPLLLAATAITLTAQTFNTLVSFDTGYGPLLMSFAQGTDGNLYGTTAYGGSGTGGCYGDSPCGTVFKMTPGGSLTILHDFIGIDGNGPFGELLLGTDGNFYGTTYWGGANLADCLGNWTGGCGTVFKITPSGTLTTLHSFAGGDGEYPSAGLVQATNGDFYGTTEFGGANCPPSGCGTVFRITARGTLTTLYSFCAQANCTDGAYPNGALIQATNGNLYGTTTGGGGNSSCMYAGGVVGCGTVFEITPEGKLTTLHSFDDGDGAFPEAGLVQATNGDFYSTTVLGGPAQVGTVFKITPSGTLTTLYTFSGGAYGADPTDGLVQATDGNFYGTTSEAGTGAAYSDERGECGTIFKITPAGVLTTLYNFCSQPNCADGSEEPGYAVAAAGFGGLFQATSGTFYGTTNAGGMYNLGTAFSLAVGLKPFVETNPTSGAVGAKVTILGNNLTGSTSVTFNGTLAAFTVNSMGTAIATTVPSGATTGYVKVTTPSGTLTSNVKFRVP